MHLLVRQPSFELYRSVDTRALACVYWSASSAFALISNDRAGCRVQPNPWTIAYVERHEHCGLPVDDGELRLARLTVYQRLPSSFERKSHRAIAVHQDSLPDLLLISKTAGSQRLGRDRPVNVDAPLVIKAHRIRMPEGVVPRLLRRQASQTVHPSAYRPQSETAPGCKLQRLDQVAIGKSRGIGYPAWRRCCLRHWVSRSCAPTADGDGRHDSAGNR
jgi:hypothetical protein